MQAFFGPWATRALCSDILRTISEKQINTLLRTDYRCLDAALLPRVCPEGPLNGDVLLAITMHAIEQSTGSLYPDVFLHRVFWRFGARADAHERCFLNLLDSAASEARQVRNLFQGECLSFLKCPHCLHSRCISQDNERFFVALDIPTHDGARSMSDVQSCLDQFFKEECVDAFYCWEGCTNCGMSSGIPHRFLNITSTPQMLCLKLNFFDQS